MSQTKSEHLADDLPSEVYMQSTTELHLRQDRRDKSRIPLDVHFENLLALFDSVVASAITASAKSHEPSDQVTARSLDDSLFELRIWSENIKAVMPDADSSRNSLRILGKLGEPIGAKILKIFTRLELDLTELSADTADSKLAFGDQFRATCGRVKASIDGLHGLQDALVEELTTREGDIRNILKEERDPANHRLPVVCFGGGGVRSYSSLVILKALMDEVRSVAKASEENAIAKSIRPCDVFMYMFGSSSGGLLAIMLGRLNMTDEQCKKTFRTYAESIFRRHRRRYHSFVPLATSKYSSEALVRATKTVVESFDPSPESQKWKRNMFAAPAEPCRCGVLAFALADDAQVVGVPYVFRTYNNTSSGARNPGMANDCQIWKVALATTAAPGCFPIAHFDGKAYLNGRIAANDPSGEAFAELSDLHPNNPICLVSIGSGKRRARGLGRYYLPLIPAVAVLAVAVLATKTRRRAKDHRQPSVKRGSGLVRTHEHMRGLPDFQDRVSYFRFDAPGLEDVTLDEWTVKTREQWPNSGKIHTVDFIEMQTKRYLAEDETRTMIRACARRVVDSYCSSRGSVFWNR